MHSSLPCHVVGLREQFNWNVDLQMDSCGIFMCSLIIGDSYIKYFNILIYWLITIDIILI